MTTHENDHARFRRQLADHLLDLLDEQETALVEEHARSCADCGRLLAAARHQRSDWWEGTGHPPVSLLASSPQDERVRQHVAACAECRAEVALLSGEVVDPLPAPPFQPLQAPTVRRSPRGTIWVTAGSMAAVLAVVLVARQHPATEHASASPPANGVAPAAPSAPAPSAAVPAPGAQPSALRMTPVVIHDATRGEPAPVTAVVIPAGVSEVPLTLPALFVPEGVTLVVELRRANGDVLSRQELPVARALAPGGVRLDARRLGSGPHVLRVAWLDNASGAESREYPLDVTTNR